MNELLLGLEPTMRLLRVSESFRQYQKEPDRLTYIRRSVPDQVLLRICPVARAKNKLSEGSTNQNLKTLRLIMEMRQKTHAVKPEASLIST